LLQKQFGILLFYAVQDHLQSDKEKKQRGLKGFMIEIGRLHHCTFVVTDLDASRYFYVDVLGMVEVARPTAFDFQGQWFRKNGYEVHTIYAGISPTPTKHPPTTPDKTDVTMGQHICFSIANVDNAIAHLATHGVAIVAGPRDRGDGATQLYVYDPDGHLIELVYEPWEWR
jgi:glyoxylase I family protein